MQKNAVSSCVFEKKAVILSPIFKAYHAETKHVETKSVFYPAL